MVYPWGDNRRFNSYTNYFKREFGQRVQKVTINAGFTCPNRDGKLSTGGCSFCNNDAFNPSYCVPEKGVKLQIEEGMEFHGRRYKNIKDFIAYFQAYSNTYASLDQLKEVYDQALEFDEIVGIVIGTRPDCIDEEKLAYFKELSQKKYLIIEYGVESCYDVTLERINRGHTFAQSVKAIEMTATAGIKVGAHFILGLPGETKQQMIDGVEMINNLPLNNIKFHQLQIVVDTILGEQFKAGKADVKLFEMEEYIDLFIEILERLNPAFVLERFAGESPPRYLLHDAWGLRNDQLLLALERKLEAKDTWQGRLYNQN